MSDSNPTPCRNFMYAMLNAVGTDQETMQWLEINDSKATTNDALIEENYYSAWNAVLAADASKINIAVNGTPINHSGKESSTQVGVLQAQYQKDSTTAQTEESECDGATQAAQQTVGQDGSNLQNQAQLGSTLNTVAASMASMLSHAY